MAHMVGPDGHVVGVEHIPELIEISTRNVLNDHPEYIKEGRVKFVGKVFFFFYLMVAFDKKLCDFFRVSIFC